MLMIDSAIISAISLAVTVSENEDAELWCTVDAFPLSAEHVTWRRPGFQFDTRTVQSFKNGTSYLTVRGVTRKDMGQFYCVAENGLGNETSRAAYLVIKRKYLFNFFLISIYFPQISQNFLSNLLYFP